MGQDWLSCATTQIGEKNSPTHFLHNIMQSAWITGTVPVGYYSHSFSTALISPFTLLCLPCSHQMHHSLKAQNAKLILLITGLLFDSVIIALLFHLSSAFF